MPIYLYPFVPMGDINFDVVVVKILVVQGINAANKFMDLVASGGIIFWTPGSDIREFQKMLLGDRMESGHLNSTRIHRTKEPQNVHMVVGAPAGGVIMVTQVRLAHP